MLDYMNEDHSSSCQKEDLKNQSTNIAIFWDIENVTPGCGSFLADGLLKYAKSIGKVVVQNAYADWSEKYSHQVALDLAKKNFYMVHLPHRGKNNSTKNSSDIQLVVDAIDTLQVYKHIDHYILVTGDSDFRPLLRPLRRMGKSIHIVCDVRKAPRDLLLMADSFQDFRELLPNRDDDGPKAELKVARLVNTEGEEEQITSVVAQSLNIKTDDHPTVEKAMQELCAILERPETFTEKEVDEEGYVNYCGINRHLRKRRVQVQDFGFNRFKEFMTAAEGCGLIETKSENLCCSAHLVNSHGEK